jgi:hypothetical protein
MMLPRNFDHAFPKIGGTVGLNDCIRRQGSHHTGLIRVVGLTQPDGNKRRDDTVPLHAENLNFKLWLNFDIESSRPQGVDNGYISVIVQPSQPMLLALLKGPGCWAAVEYPRAERSLRA